MPCRLISGAGAFGANEGNPREPTHIHVERGEYQAKFWLRPEISIAYNDSEAGEQKLYLFDAKKIMAPTFGSVRGKKLGEVVSTGPDGVRIHAQGGFIEVSRLRLGEGAKVKSSEINLPVGTILGAPPTPPEA
ncbi:MAG: DUF4160 domain-containing protein [Alphaproteobacteria bacterium]|nr:MAG: DUF4160 domain-containing protein [Alphaproteobacteria bacterium]